MCCMGNASAEKLNNVSAINRFCEKMPIHLSQTDLQFTGEKMQHHFDIQLATEYGMLEAILLNHFEFWIAKNEANNSNFYDNDYWTYNSTRALQKLFPYVSQRKIQNALKHLIDEDILKTGNYNKSAYDRTLWYTFTKKGKCIMQKCEMEDAIMSNQLCKNVKPIPDNNTYNNSNNIYSRVIDELNNLCGTHYKATTSKTKRLIDARINEGFTEDDFFKVIAKKASTWKGTKMEKYLRPETLFGTKFESYLNEKISSGNPFLDMLNERQVVNE